MTLIQRISDLIEAFGADISSILTMLEVKVTGSGINRMEVITQTAYDALPTKVSTTFYVITE
jgi:hypothetical protein